MTAHREDGSARSQTQTTACRGNSAYQAYAMQDGSKFLQVTLIVFATCEEYPTNCLPSAGDSVTVSRSEASLCLASQNQHPEEQEPTLEAPSEETISYCAHFPL